jgi:hypothetical protein
MAKKTLRLKWLKLGYALVENFQLTSRSCLLFFKGFHRESKPRSKLFKAGINKILPHQ